MLDVVASKPSDSDDMEASGLLNIQSVAFSMSPPYNQRRRETQNAYKHFFYRKQRIYINQKRGDQPRVPGRENPLTKELTRTKSKEPANL